jgi:hypothetical protein
MLLSIFLHLRPHVIDEIPHIPIIYGTTEFKKWTVQKDLKLTEFKTEMTVNSLTFFINLVL